MEEIEARFEMIQLAVKMGEHDTVKKQVEKLRVLSMDDSLAEILDLLESKNYRQALYMMNSYHETLKDDFFDDPEEQESSENESASEKENEGEMPKSSKEHHYEKGERVLNLDDLLKMSEGMESRVREYSSPVVQDSGESDLSDTGSSAEADDSLDIVFNADEKVEAEESSRNSREESLFDIESESDEDLRSDEKIGESEDSPEESGSPISVQTDENAGSEREQDADTIVPDSGMEEGHEAADSEAVPSLASRKKFGPDGGEDAVMPASSEKTGGISRKRYPPISYISQKYKNMTNQFHPLESEAPVCPEVLSMQKKISESGYSEEEIAKFLKQYQKYKEEGDKDRAAQVLLLAAATESKFAQFMLARELFKGDVLQEDHAESFTQINSLADQNFAEAICDLGQFYEHGIGISKDRQMALLLYEEAAEMGVERAKRHYERLGGSKGLFGFLTGFMKKKKKKEEA